MKALDPIYIRFSGIMEQQQLELVIDENGEISLLHIEEPIKAAGLTTSALEQKIERCYVDGGIYKNVSVNVTMTAKVYYVQGEVMQPGQFQLMSGTTLLQAIAGARGYTAFANKKKVTITRHGKIYAYNVRALEKDPSKDVKIEAGDVIKVWQQWY
ncbi:MAG: polysaccharide biosynthesis/export family protein [Verrucomicrobiota bacterium]